MLSARSQSKKGTGTSPVVQWLRFYASTTVGIPALVEEEDPTLHTVQPKMNKHFKNKNQKK